MTEYTTNTTKDFYSLKFTTSNKKAYEQVETLCRILVDGKEGNAIPIEWIKNWRKREWFDSTLSMEERAVRSLVSRMILEDWEEENEID